MAGVNPAEPAETIPEHQLSPEELENKTISDAFSAITSYLSCDLDDFCSEVSLLTELNDACYERYSEIKETMGGVTTKLSEVNSRCSNLIQSLDKIRRFDPSISRLESAAETLKLYSEKLELLVNRAEVAE